MFKLVMVDVIKDLHDHVWAKLFWKELFEGPPIMAIVIHHDQIALLEFLWPHPFIKKIYFDELGLV